MFSPYRGFHVRRFPHKVHHFFNSHGVQLFDVPLGVADTFFSQNGVFARIFTEKCCRLFVSVIQGEDVRLFRPRVVGCPLVRKARMFAELHHTFTTFGAVPIATQSAPVSPPPITTTCLFSAEMEGAPASFESNKLFVLAVGAVPMAK